MPAQKISKELIESLSPDAYAIFNKDGVLFDLISLENNGSWLSIYSIGSDEPAEFDEWSRYMTECGNPLENCYIALASEVKLK